MHRFMCVYRRKRIRAGLAGNESVLIETLTLFSYLLQAGVKDCPNNSLVC